MKNLKNFIYQKFWVMKSRRMILARHTVDMEEKINDWIILVGKGERRTQLEWP
jgi:hypothetical protein